MEGFHKAAWAILYHPVRLFLWLKFRYTAEQPKHLPDHFIVLSNHATNFDPLLLAMAFPKQVYFVASEHVSRWGFASKLLMAVLNPILRAKGSLASNTVKEILRRTRAGHNVAIFAEGNTTWDGVTGDILPSTGKLVQKSGCGLVTYRLVGGYFAYPRWSTSGQRKGYMHGEVVNVYTPEQLAAMNAKEINGLICRDLYENAYDRQTLQPARYRSKAPAEGMEHFLYLCPKCGAADHIRTHGDQVECTACGSRFTYTDQGILEGSPYPTLRELSLWQKEQAEQAAERGESYTDPQGTLTVIADNTAQVVSTGKVTLSAQALTCGDTVIPLETISELDIHSKHSLVFTAEKVYYELTPSGNALKFLLLYKAYHGR